MACWPTSGRRRGGGIIRPCTRFRLCWPHGPLASWLRTSTPATPGSHRLPLLPLGPSGVHGPPPCGTIPSTLLDQRLTETRSLEREFNPAYGGLRATRHRQRPV